MGEEEKAVPDYSVSVWEKYKKPRKPWRASTAYEIFCKQERPRLKGIFGATSSRDVNKELGVIWQSFSKKKKEHYQQLAKNEKMTARKNLKQVEKNLGKKLKKPV